MLKKVGYGPLLKIAPLGYWGTLPQAPNSIIKIYLLKVGTTAQNFTARDSLIRYK